MQTLLPRYWVPIGSLSFSGAGSSTSPRSKVLGSSVGAFTSGVDVVGRHAYNVGARIFLPTGGYAGGRAAGLLSYGYAGLGNPTLGLLLSQNWNEELVRVREGNGGAPADTTFILERSRLAAVSMTLARPRAWNGLSFTLSGGLLQEDREALNSELRPADLSKFDSPHSTLGDVTARFSASTARSHAFQMGRAAGVSFSAWATRRIDFSGESSDDRSVDAVSGDFRTYVKLPGGGFAAPVMALRASAGAVRGPDSGRGYFKVGGSARRLFPVRGYENTPRSGRRAWSASLELRLPAALVNRAIRTSLLHFDRALSHALRRRGQRLGTRQSQPGIHAAGTPIRWALSSSTISVSSMLQSASASARGTGSPIRKAPSPTSTSARRFEPVGEKTEWRIRLPNARKRKGPGDSSLGVVLPVLPFCHLCRAGTYNNRFSWTYLRASGPFRKRIRAPSLTNGSTLLSLDTPPGRRTSVPSAPAILCVTLRHRSQGFYGFGIWESSTAKVRMTVPYYGVLEIRFHAVAGSISVLAMDPLH